MGKDIDIDEIQKDISEYISKKYGIKFKVAAFGAAPETAREKGEEGAKESEKRRCLHPFRHEARGAEGLPGRVHGQAG